MTGCRVRVLADDKHPNLIEGKPEGPQHVRPGRKKPPAGVDLRAQELPHRRDLAGHRCQRGRPTRVDEFVEGHSLDALERLAAVIAGREARQPTGGQNSRRVRIGGVL